MRNLKQPAPDEYYLLYLTNRYQSFRIIQMFVRPQLVLIRISHSFQWYSPVSDHRLLHHGKIVVPKMKRLEKSFTHYDVISKYFES